MKSGAGGFRMNPFSYPKNRHRRKESPPAYRDYRSFKPFLQNEFGSRCVYCCLPDGIKGYDSFGVDHYLPQKPFGHLITTYSNLFYSCNCCNSRKKNFWPNQAQIRDGEFIPNPCDHEMFQHLQYKAAVVAPKSPAGKKADEILDFNDDESVKYREFVRDLIAAKERDRRESIDLIRDIDHRLALQPGRTDLMVDRRDVEQDLAKTEEHLLRLCGSPI